MQKLASALLPFSKVLLLASSPLPLTSPPAVKLFPGPGLLLLSGLLRSLNRAAPFAGISRPEDWYIGNMVSKAQFCGRLYDHAMQTGASPFYVQTEGTAGAKPYTKDNVEDLLKIIPGTPTSFNKPSICTKAVMVKDTKDKMTTPECKTGTQAKFSLGDDSTEPTFTFVSPAIAWTGVCQNGQCLVCTESEERCPSHGIKQQCVVAVDSASGEAKTEWVRFRGSKSDLTMVLPDLMQSFRITCALLGLVCIIMLLQCFSGFSLMKMSRSRTAADAAGFKDAVVSVPSDGPA